MGALSIPECACLHGITDNNTTTATDASASTQSSAPQTLTSPTESALMQTPTMSFGEVGETRETTSSGYPRLMGGVGHYDKTQVLERMRLMYGATWTTSVSAGATVYSTDIVRQLLNVTANDAILSQFQYFRADVELTVRINTNQFYYGALMVTLFPNGTGQRRIDERAILDPTIMSASSAEAVVKTLKYSYPYPWMPTGGVASGWFPGWLFIDCLAPLTISNSSMPSSVSIQLWARFTNVELSYPTDTAVAPGSSPLSPTSDLVLSTHKKTPSVASTKKKKYLEAQSANGSIKVKFPKKGRAAHPADDPENGISTVDTAIDAISSVTIGDAVQGVKSLASFVSDNWGGFTSALSFLLDKPDQSDPQFLYGQEASKDMFCTDIADTNVSVSMYKNRYCDPGIGRMPQSKNWTLSEYARIPGLRTGVIPFTTQNQAIVINLLQKHPDNSSMKIPFDYACLSSYQWRGSIKVCLYFFTSSFISARFTVQYINAALFPSTYPTEYDCGLTRVINVKGDVIDSFTLPWISYLWWARSPAAQIQITCETEIANTDTGGSPTIYCVPFVAAGDDVQFAYPTIVDADDWSGLTPTQRMRRDQQRLPRDKGKEREAQSTPGSMFQSTFPPIGENTQYNIDNGYCTAEMLGPMTDIAKRYSQIPIITDSTITPTPIPLIQCMDDQYEQFPSADTLGYYDYFRFRNTLFGSMRACFLFRSGGYRFRRWCNDIDDNFAQWQEDLIGSTSLPATMYQSGNDCVARLTIPQIMQLPYAQLGYINYQLQFLALGTVPIDQVHPAYLAARDDLQFGYPILPSPLIWPGDLS